MADWVKRALMRKVKRKSSRGSQQVIVVEPDERLVYVVKFAMAMLACLSAVEIAHLAILRTWNSEIFAAITGLSGTVMGIFVGSKS
jgi:hypothetical protein